MALSGDGYPPATGDRAPAPGDVFAQRYEIRALLGRGGMGTVFAAFDQDVGDTVALKVLRGDTHDRPGVVTRFRSEVRLARRITHRNVARIYDLGEFGNTLYLTMEYVEGRSLRELLARKRRLSAERAVSIARQVCDGLAAAADAGVVHRDLKPANVLIERDGRVVITDFGIARAAEVDEHLTGDNVGLVGTPAYMAPEQVAGDDVDPRADLYAVGLLLFEMITGRPAFAGKNPMATALQRLDAPAPDPRPLAPVPDAVAETIAWCLQRNPERRPASATALGRVLRDLEGVEASAARSSADEPTSSPAAPTPTSRFAATSPGDRALAVLPFRYRGPPGREYLAEAVSDELIDTLSMTRGIKVAASGATSAHEGGRDPRVIGRDLGVGFIVDGTVTLGDQSVRIAARLVSVDTGFQRWSDRFDGPLETVFDLQDRLARRIAETLRLELQTLTHRGDAPAEAVELYFRARRRAREVDLGGAGPDGSVGLLERCLELAPHFLPAVAARAIVCVRAWFLPEMEDLRDWQAQSEDAVEAALRVAPNLAETQLAAARLSVQQGDFSGATSHLARALEIAPTYPAAHAYLGRLQCEAGRATEGIRHILLARDLDPTNKIALSDVARHHALHGDTEAYEQTLTDLKTSLPGGALLMVLLEMRVAGWHRDFDRVKRCAASIERSDHVNARLLHLLAGSLLGRLAPDQTEQLFKVVADHVRNPRRLSFALQVGTEAVALQGRIDAAFAYLQRAADGTLIDVDWLERCPALEPLRQSDQHAGVFDRVRDQVRARAAAMWKL